MIHLDHNHSSSIPTPAKPQNLILSSNSPHADQHRVLSWSSPARDHPRPFYHDPQEHFLSDSTSPHNSSTAPLSAVATPAPPPDTERPPPPTERSPSSPADARSPPADSSSSLSPPPDAATPHNAMEPPDDPPGRSTTTDADTHNPDKTGDHAADEVDRASRQSTPLSELSSAPETLPEDNETAIGDDPTNPAQGARDSRDGPHGGGAHSSGATKDSSSLPPASASAKGGSRSLHYQIPLSSSMPQTPTPNLKPFANNYILAGTDLDGFPAHKIAQGGQPFLPEPSALPSTSQSKNLSLDPKVVSILELNALLLRVSMEYQARGVPMTDPTFNQYSLRLQSNLTWLAAAADENHKVAQSMMALPVMQPPPAVEFVDMERISQIYRHLPDIFAKEIARRQQASGGLMNGNAKRERTEEPGQDSLHKRRDTGETKPQIPASFASPGAGPSVPHVPSQPMQQMPNATVSVNMVGGSVPRVSSPSMPPPPVPSGNMAHNEQMAAARRAQMRQAMQLAEPNRQMSPPSGLPPGMAMSNMQNVAGPSSMPNMPQLTPPQMATLTAMGPHAVQHFQILQNPNHPLVQFLVQQIPGFMQLPLQERLQKMQAAQNMMQARQQQRAAAAQAQGMQGSGSMGGYPQGGMQGGIALQHPGDGSPSRMSPVSQQSPMQPSFPQANNLTGDPRSMMTPQQRQLQQMMRAGGAGGGMNPQLTQQQMMQLQMQERMRQAQAQAAASGQGSPSSAMGSPMADGPQIPILRSNSSMPGIARSGRTPSDSVPSPVSQHRLSMSSQSPEELQRAMMMQQAVHHQRGMTPQMPNAGFGNGGGMNPAYVAQMQQQMAMGGGGQGQNVNVYGMGSPPGSAGGGGGQGGFGGGGGGMPSPAGGNLGQMWAQSPGAGGQGYPGGGPFMAPSPSASQHDGMTPGRQTSATPGPQQQQMVQSSSGDQGLNEFDFFTWA